MREGLRGIDNHAVERQALALVNGDCPRKFERVLTERTVHNFSDFLRLLIDFVRRVRPLGGHNFNGIVGAAAIHIHLAVLNVDNAADFAIVEPFFGRRVVFDKHHLRAFLQFQLIFSGIHLFGEVSADFGLELHQLAFQLLEFALVYVVRLEVVGCERYVSVLVFWLKIRLIALIEFGKDGGIGGVVAHAVQNVDKVLARLAVNLLEFNNHVIGLAQGVAAEEVHRRVSVAQQIPLIVLDHGRQLVQVANHQQLHAAKRLLVAPIAPQHVVNGIEQIGPDHRNLVNNQ